nr:MAG TPA: hypothetical protein [Caudoviricetes sp.]
MEERTSYSAAVKMRTSSSSGIEPPYFLTAFATEVLMASL